MTARPRRIQLSRAKGWRLPHAGARCSRGRMPRLRDAKTGERTGTIDICRDEDGVVHLRAVRAGEVVILRMLPKVAGLVAQHLRDAAEGGAA